ncbi:type II secretion system secretin GspD [Pseudoxanthomonas koreensis]|uniref:type II secretion system secretin GspD n=1 Tax=Pseudoxanthomonas koreensis TaxID=266061 RepID=UPI0035A6C3D6
MVLRFDAADVAPDLRNQIGSVVVDVPGARVPSWLTKVREVEHLGTPVHRIQARAIAGGIRIVLHTSGETDTHAYQSGSDYVLDLVPASPVAADPGQDAPAEAVMRHGSGEVINRAAAARSRRAPSLDAAANGTASFNFEGESLHAVVRVILGEMLGQNYVIAPDVSGRVTLSTPQPLAPAQAMGLLEMVLGWNNARMVYSDGRYNIVAANQALAGSVAPSTAPPGSARGFEVRMVPLRFISASEMKKALQPYARPDAIVDADNARNIITVAGTRAELENYQQTIAIFDVDWMASMSVGVFPLSGSRSSRVVADLERVFGDQGGSPLAGMFRFMPLDGANAVMAITPQPQYLRQIGDWIERIDGAGEGVRLYSQELRYITARDLARRLAEVFGSGADPSGMEDAGAPLMPGLEPTTIHEPGVDGAGGSFASIGGSGASLDPSGAGGVSMTLRVDGDAVGISAVEENNTLLVRANAAAWRSIRDVIHRLDVMPLQVHIEAQVAEVTLSGELDYGVSWYLRNADGGTPTAPSNAGLRNLSASGLLYTFGVDNGIGIINALDQVSEVRMLQSPSVTVRNNHEATFTVGSKIPVASVSVNTIGAGDTVSQVQYLDTGTILKVRPRVTRDGTVFLDIVQEVSSPGAESNINGNVTINNRRLKTNAIINSGDTVLLAGLIQDSHTRGSSGMPGLSRLPVVGGLFGRRTRSSSRSEVIVLLTPTLVTDPVHARQVTDDYGRRFRSLRPLLAPGAR